MFYFSMYKLTPNFIHSLLLFHSLFHSIAVSCVLVIPTVGKEILAYSELFDKQFDISMNTILFAEPQYF